jgi:hypothetical protein
LSEDKQTVGRLALSILLACLFLGWSPCWFRDATALAGQLTVQGGSQLSSSLVNDKAGLEETSKEAPCHTPLAGEAGRTSFLGYPVEIPALDRGHLTSITLGGTLLDPKQGDTRAIPFAALYLRRVEEEYRTRDTVSIFVNELEYDRRFGNLELVGHFENYTLPGARTELGNGRSVPATSVVWGTLLGALGPGLCFPMAPGEVDNLLRVQLLGRAGYFYAGRNHDTGTDQLLPPDTLLYGAKLRVRYDGMRRNLLELPHEGFATGFDVDYLSRDKWRDLGGGLSSGNRDYLQANGYLVGAGGIPGLSERNRVLLSIYGGTTAGDRGDRYNAFHLNGGPFPSEADDLPRQHYTGIVYDDILASRFATLSLGYRREIAFFLYLSLIESCLWADRVSARDNGQVLLKNTTAVSSTVSLDCAFFWNSEFYLAYAWDSGAIRGGKSGSGLLLTWNKLF